MEFKIDKKTLKRIIIGVIICIVAYWVLNDFVGVKSVFNSVIGVMSPFIVGMVFAFIVNVPNRTVVTAMDQTETTSNIFTNIDGAVIM